VEVLLNDNECGHINLNKGQELIKNAPMGMIAYRSRANKESGWTNHKNSLLFVITSANQILGKHTRCFFSVMQGSLDRT